MPHVNVLRWGINNIYIYVPFSKTHSKWYLISVEAMTSKRVQTYQSWRRTHQGLEFKFLVVIICAFSRIVLYIASSGIDKYLAGDWMVKY